MLGFMAQATVFTPTTLPNPKVQDQRNYVCNPDEIVATNEVIFLNRLARQLEDSTQVELCVVAVNSIGEMDAFDFCYEVFQRWGIGKEGKNTGVLLFLAVESRDIRIMTGGGIEGILTDAICNEIIGYTSFFKQNIFFTNSDTKRVQHQNDRTYVWHIIHLISLGLHQVSIGGKSIFASSTIRKISLHHNYKTMCLTHKKQIIKLICYIIIAACNNNIICS